MTTAAPVSHFMMDAPGLNDQMELTSDHPVATENTDDFDIDLDLMQDQEPDNDVIVDDALPEIEDPEEAPGHISDTQHDADMLDEEITEEQPSTTNAPYEQYQEGYYQTDETYHDNNNSYEAEMVDGFEEEMATPVPNAESAEPLVAVPSEGTGNIESQPPKSPKDDEAHIGSTKSSEDTGIPELEGDHIPVRESQETGSNQEEAVDQESRSVPEVSNAEQQRITNQEHTDTDHNVTSYPKTATSHGGRNVTESEHLQVTEESGQTRIPPDTEDTEHGDYEQEEQDEVQTSEIVTELPSLPPIKILYQDNEISLFPPREGDSSEIFFLQDEALASENLAELLKECRQVLGDHIAEGEELTLDIDSLNLHLTEDSLRTTEITLFQIVEVYLHLCHNDGLNDPEPLYIALDTKTNFLTEFSNLVAAAHDGQGLSSLHAGNDLDHGDTDGDAGHDGNLRSPGDEPHGGVQPKDSEFVGYDDAQANNFEDEAQDEPQDETQGASIDEIQQNDLEQVEYNEAYESDTEVAADREYQPTDSERVGADDEQVSNVEDGTYEEIKPSGSVHVQGSYEQISGVENEAHDEPQSNETEALDNGGLEAVTITDENETSNEVEQPAGDFEEAAVSEAISSHSFSSHTAGNFEYDAGNFKQGEEIQEEVHEDDIDLGYVNESAGADNANPTIADEGNEQEEPQDEPEDPASPKEDLFEFEDQDYESPGTLGQPSSAQSPVDQELDHEATRTQHEDFSVGEENRRDESVPAPAEDQQKQPSIHDNRYQDEIDVFDEDGQYDESIDPTEKNDSRPVEAPSLESGECSPSPQEDIPTLAVQQDNVTPKTDDATGAVMSSRHEEQKPVDSSEQQAGEEIIAKTPDPFDGLYEIDEDLFRSPTKELDHNNPTSAPDPIVGESPVPADASHSNNDMYDPDEIHFDDDDDADESLKNIDHPEVPVDVGISDNSQSGKRSREEEDEINPSESITPDVKRRRSQ